MAQSEEIIQSLYPAGASACTYAFDSPSAEERTRRCERAGLMVFLLICNWLDHWADRTVWVIARLNEIRLGWWV